MTTAALRVLGPLLIALAAIMQGECEIVPDGAAIAGHVALNRRAWYDDITTGWRGACAVEDVTGEYLWLAADVLAEHHAVDHGYLFAVSAEDKRRLGLPASAWCYERKINGRVWAMYAYTEEEWRNAP